MKHLSKILFTTLFIITSVNIANAADTFGAMSVCTQTGGWGYVSKNKRTAKEAVDTAYSFCLQHGNSSCCTKRTYIKNECGAIARGKNSGFVFGLGTGDTQKKAAIDALGKCDNKASNCELKIMFCTK